MPIVDICQALNQKEDALVRHFLSVWPLVTSILEAFSKATQLPIFVYLNEAKVFQSSIDTMPQFCSTMLKSPLTEKLCTQDGLNRARGLEPEIVPGIQCCHAGMISGRREIDTGCVGVFIVLFGSRKSIEQSAILRRKSIIQLARANSANLADQLEQADNSDIKTGIIEDSNIELMSAISDIIHRLLAAIVGFRSLTINMAHELSLMMLGLGLLAKNMEATLESKNIISDAQLIEDLEDNQKHILAESQLGLYVVRNFLSHTSESRYDEIVSPKFAEMNLANTLSDMIDLHKLHAGAKKILFESEGISDIPKIYGSDMEIRRLLHNILNNAIKYSYHSVNVAQRIVKIKAKIPYDPGFRSKRFSITFENYGLGVSEDERSKVLEPGFRGKQAAAQVPIGAGIGLSEAAKIMKIHDGEIKFRSKKLYGNESIDATYLTTIELIFPYSRKS